jgi:hypothetical protein
MIRVIARRLLGLAFGDYAANRVYRLGAPVDAPALPDGGRLALVGDDELAALRAHPDPKVRKSAGFAGPSRPGYALWVGDSLASVAFFAERTAFDADWIWRLGETEAALVELITPAEHRGKGLAPCLIAHASNTMLVQGKTSLLTWIWWSNTPSIRAFEKAGWHRIGIAYRIYPLGILGPFDWRRPLT